MNKLASKQQRSGLYSKFCSDCIMSLKTPGFYFLSYKYNPNSSLSFSGFSPFENIGLGLVARH